MLTGKNKLMCLHVFGRFSKLLPLFSFPVIKVLYPVIITNSSVVYAMPKFDFLFLQIE